MTKQRTLKVGIAPRSAVFQYMRNVVAGRRRRTTDDPDIPQSDSDVGCRILDQARFCQLITQL
jgi:hypothetical protein